MKKCFWVLVILGFVLTTPAMLVAADVNNIEILGYGTYKVGIAKIIKETNKIPAIKDLAFGFQYIVHGKPLSEKVKLKSLIIFPESGLMNPKTGEAGYKYEGIIYAKIGKIKRFGYVFREEWLMVPGNWTFQIWYEGKKLAEKTFTVYIP